MIFASAPGFARRAVRLRYGVGFAAALAIVLSLAASVSSVPAFAEAELGEQKPSARGRLPKAEPLPRPAERGEERPERKGPPERKAPHEGGASGGCPYSKKSLELIV